MGSAIEECVSAERVCIDEWLYYPAVALPDAGDNEKVEARHAALRPDNGRLAGFPRVVVTNGIIA